MIELKTILVPTDFSECSDAAVKYGAALAKAFGATLHLLNVVQDPYTLPCRFASFDDTGILRVVDRAASALR